MNQTTIKDTNQFSEIVYEIEKAVQKIIEISISQKKNAEEINDTDVWTGNAARIMYAQYSVVNSNYEHIEYSLDLYVKFMKKVLEDYTRLNEEFNKNIDDFGETLDVNSNQGKFENVNDTQ